MRGVKKGDATECERKERGRERQEGEVSELAERE